VDATHEKLIDIAKVYWQNGLRKIVALRGDLLQGVEKPQSYASDLVALLK
jgi:methylenetetrahydrofolate reductase (NADPH)